MRVCVVGAGAIGGMIAVKLHLAGETVCVIDKGSQLSAIRDNGLRLHWGNGSIRKARLEAYDSAADAGKQDLVVLGVKTYDLECAVRHIGPLLGADTMVMTLQNGIPWWYFHKEGGAFDGTRLRSVDPNGALSGGIDARRIIGCVAYPAAALVEPGVVHHVEGDRFPVGELDGAHTDRVKRISEALSNSGLKSRVIGDIRAEAWLKAMGNLAFNPISALSHATMAGIFRLPETKELAAAMMGEAYAVAAKLGIKMRHTIAERLAGAEKVGEHKTSMLQDLDAGHPLETEALVGAVLEIGRLTKTPTPLIEAVYALLKLRERSGAEAPSAAFACHATAKIRAA